MKKKKLQFKELQAARLALKGVPAHFHPVLAALFWHIEVLDAKILETEQELRELRRKILPPEKPKTVYKREPRVSASLPERLANMIMGLYGQNMTDGHWERTLRWSDLTEEEARAMAEPIIQSREAERLKFHSEEPSQDSTPQPAQNEQS